MNHLEKSLSSFFNADLKVIVIKGEWGVGKTYFWDNYISGRIDKKDISNIAYSYISLFGKTSLKEVRASIFHNAIPISNDSEVQKSFEDEYKKSKVLFEKIPWLKDGIDKVKDKKSWVHWMSKKAQLIPAVNKYSSMISTLEYSLVNNYVICFDDMERKGKGLEVKEVMSLIDELAERKNCKVVLIFNESSLDNGDDKKQFEVYREKVVDMELLHNPSFKDNLECVFLNDE